MKVKNIDLVAIMNRLDSYGTKKLPQKISYAITRNLMLISTEYNIYEKALNKIFETYQDDMVKDDDGNIKYSNVGVPIVSDSVFDEYNREISDLLCIEVDIDLYHIPKESFDYSDETGRYDAMSPRDIMILESILCEKE